MGLLSHSPERFSAAVPYVQGAPMPRCDDSGYSDVASFLEVPGT